jgi:HEAT repeat protein
MQSATVTQKERCISTLIKVLQDTDSEVRAAAALALGGYGPAAKAALPALVRLVHDENVDTARAAGVALQCIAPPPAAAQIETRFKPLAAGAVDGR